MVWNSHFKLKQTWYIRGKQIKTNLSYKSSLEKSFAKQAFSTKKSKDKTMEQCAVVNIGIYKVCVNIGKIFESLLC